TTAVGWNGAPTPRCRSRRDPRGRANDDQVRLLPAILKKRPKSISGVNWLQKFGDLTTVIDRRREHFPLYGVPPWFAPSEQNGAGCARRPMQALHGFERVDLRCFNLPTIRGDFRWIRP